MKIYYSIPLFVLTSFVSATAQNITIEEIRRSYQEIISVIQNPDSLQTGNSVPYFTDELFINSRKIQKPKTGADYMFWLFVYNYPDLASPNQPQLVLARQAQRLVNQDIQKEFLFNEKNQLVFYYEKSPEEIRLYYNNGVLIRCQLGQTILKDIASKQVFAKNILFEAAPDTQTF